MTGAAVFLDRDGVINEVVLRAGRSYPPDSVDGLRILPGVVGAVRDLRSAGYRVIVVTNQPDVGAGAQTVAGVEAIHERIGQTVAVDEFRVCYHAERDGCACRKPKPGMLLAAAASWGIDLPRSFMVGDRWRDVGAGRAAGCTTFLVGSGYGESPWLEPDALVGSLAEASTLILSGGVPTCARGADR